MLPLQHGHSGPVSAQLVRHRVLFFQDSREDILAVMEIFVELTTGLQHLISCINELPEVSPGVIERVLPLGDGVTRVASV